MFAISHARAAIQTYRSIFELISSADAVVVGTITNVVGQGNDENGTFVIVPTRTLAGELAAGPLQLVYSRLAIAPDEELQGKQALVFLQRDRASGTFLLLPVVSGSSGVPLQNQILVAERPINVPLVPERAGDRPVQRVIKEVANIQAHSSRSRVPVSLVDLAPRRVEQDTLREVFMAMRDRGGASDYSEATAGLVALGDIQGLKALEEALAAGRTDLQQAVESLIYYRDTSREGVEILAGWLDTSRPAWIRVAGASTLAQLHTPAAVEALGPALSDSDFQVRWRAIGGLAMFANNVPIGGVGPAPGPWPFRSDETIRFSINSEEVRDREAQYLDFWMSWWREHEAAIKAMVEASKN
jgi:hypothetical protein